MAEPPGRMQGAGHTKTWDRPAYLAKEQDKQGHEDVADGWEEERHAPRLEQGVTMTQCQSQVGHDDLSGSSACTPQHARHFRDSKQEHCCTTFAAPLTVCMQAGSLACRHVAMAQLSCGGLPWRRLQNANWGAGRAFGAGRDILCMHYSGPSCS